jgi:DNA-binding CsgD family transcriptional regulator
MSIDWPARLAAHTTGASSCADVLEGALQLVQQLFRAPLGLAVFSSPAEPTVSVGLRNLHVREYLGPWVGHDPVRREALARRAAACDAEVAVVERSAFLAGFSSRLGAEAYLVAPLYGPDGAIAGTLHMWRRAGAEAFCVADSVQATAFAAFLSVMLARDRPRAARIERLAPREHQVALLAASGRTNKDIALHLGVAPETVKQTLRRVYRKTSVAGRAQLAARYARSGLL